MKSYKELQENILEHKISIPRGNLKIPRHQMPQIASKDIPEYIDFLKMRRIPVVRTKLKASKLKATQEEINKQKVIDLIKSPPANKPIIVADDSQILDGHHTWLADLNKNPECYVDAYLVGLNISDLLNTSKLFDKVFNKTVSEGNQNMPKDLVEKVREILRKSETNSEKDKKKLPKKGRKKFEKVEIDPQIRPDQFTEPYRVRNVESK